MNDADMKHLYEVMTNHYGCSFRRLKTRRRHVAEKKQMFAVISRCHGASYRQIAGFLGWTNHSTAISACRRMLGFIDVYPAFKKEFDDICMEYESRRNAGTVAESEN